MKRASLAAASVFFLACSLQAGAAPAPVPPGTIVQAPDWAANSSWYYSDGYGLKVSSSSNGVTVFERLDAPGQWFSRQGFLRKDLVSGTTTRNSIYRTLPEQAGGSLSAAAPLTFEREYLSNGKLMVHASSWTVEGRETITVPAGTFDCFVIVWRTRSLKSDWTGFERWWYSPAAQNYVRMEYKYGPAEASSRVLMRYTLGQRADAETPGLEKLAVVAPPAASTESAIAEAAPDLLPDPVSFTPLPALDGVAAATAPVELTPPELPAPPPTPVKSRPPNRTCRRPGTGAVWRVQLASSKDQPALRADFDKLLAANATRFEGIPSGIASARIAGRGTFYRAWVGAFASQRDANRLCGALKAEGGSCTVMRVSIDAAG